MPNKKQAAQAAKQKQTPKLALTVIDVAGALQVAPATVYRLAHSGVLRPSRALRTLRFSPDEINRFLNATT
jgi:hypothetical protein